jgi:hypothetical protein
MFECGNWVDRCLDMANDAGYRLEWDRFGSKYCVSLYGDERHDGTGPTLDRRRSCSSTSCVPPPRTA